MSINTNQKTSPGSQAPAVNQEQRFDDKRSEARPVAEDESLTVLFPVMDEKGNVIIGSMEGSRADIIGMMQDEGHQDTN